MLAFYSVKIEMYLATEIKIIYQDLFFKCFFFSTTT